jgi:hypothetical protein
MCKMAHPTRLNGVGGGYVDIKMVSFHIFDRDLKGLSHEIDFKNFDKHLQNLA